MLSRHQENHVRLCSNTMNHAESSPLTVNGIGPTAVKSPLFVELYNNWICFFFWGFISCWVSYRLSLFYCTLYSIYINLSCTKSFDINKEAATICLIYVFVFWNLFFGNFYFIQEMRKDKTKKERYEWVRRLTSKLRTVRRQWLLISPISGAFDESFQTTGLGSFQNDPDGWMRTWWAIAQWVATCNQQWANCAFFGAN